MPLFFDLKVKFQFDTFNFSQIPNLFLFFFGFFFSLTICVSLRLIFWAFSCYFSVVYEQYIHVLCAKAATFLLPISWTSPQPHIHWTNYLKIKSILKHEILIDLRYFFLSIFISLMFSVFFFEKKIESFLDFHNWVIHLQVATHVCFGFSFFVLLWHISDDVCTSKWDEKEMRTCTKKTTTLIFVLEIYILRFKKKTRTKANIKSLKYE